MKQITRYATSLMLIGYAGAAPLMAAPIPQDVKKLLDAAMATNDKDKLSLVADLARQTNPQSVVEITALENEYLGHLKVRAQAQADAVATKKREAGFFDNWSGKGELGGFQSSGNTSETGISAGIKLNKDAQEWQYILRLFAEYQRTEGATSKEQFLAAFEPRYQINNHLFAYALTQYERDRFQGFSARYSVSGGLGYHVIDKSNMQLSVQGGPAWRITEFVGGGNDKSIAALASLDYWWQLSDNIRLTEVASAYLQSGNKTFNSTTGIEVKLMENLSARLSYTVEVDTDPPVGREKTDTLTRATVVFGF